MEKLPESTIAYVHLGQSRNRRQVRPVPSTKANPNPPMITFQQGLISRCQRCPTKITKQDPPMDMVFRLKAIRPFMNKKTGLWQDAIGNAYFHLDVTCLKAHNQNINEEDLLLFLKMLLYLKLRFIFVDLIAFLASSKSAHWILSVSTVALPAGCKLLIAAKISLSLSTSEIQV